MILHNESLHGTAGTNVIPHNESLHGTAGTNVILHNEIACMGQLGQM